MRGTTLVIVMSALIPAGGGMGGRELLLVFESGFLRGGIDLPLARQKITAATLTALAKSLIHIEIARIVTCRAEAPWGDLHRLPILLMKDYRQTVVGAANSCDGHHDSPLYRHAARAACQPLGEAIPPLLNVLDRSRV